MPDIWAHLIFGDEVLARLQGEEVHLVRTRKKVFSFGCQGPDFFFYHNMWPWQKKKLVAGLGRQIQNIIGGKSITTGVKYLKTLQLQRVTQYKSQSFPQPVDNSGDNLVESEEYQTFMVYLLGYICHYALDVWTHPYIHYKSGVFVKEDPGTYQYYGNHSIIEGTIDHIYLMEKRGKKALKTPGYREFDLGKRLPRSVLNFYRLLIHRFLGRDIKSETINEAYLYMIKARKWTFDPWGLKTLLVHIIRFLTIGKVDWTRYFNPRWTDESLDYLNRKHAQWNHPLSPVEVHHESFDQLWGQAVEQATNWIELVLDYLHDRVDESKIDQYIPNLSFSTGKAPDLAGEKSMVFVKPDVDL